MCEGTFPLFDTCRCNLIFHVVVIFIINYSYSYRSIDKSEISQICVFQNNTTPPRARGSLTIVRRRSRALRYHTLFLGSALPLAHPALDRVSICYTSYLQTKGDQIWGFFIFLDDTQVILICFKEKKRERNLSVSVIICIYYWIYYIKKTLNETCIFMLSTNFNQAQKQLRWQQQSK